LEKDFEDFIVKRCEEAKLSNDDYLRHERGRFAPEEVQGMAEIICYQKGFSDATKIFNAALK